MFTWVLFAAQESRGLHDLARLAVAALRNVDLHPGLLDRMQSVLFQSFDCGDSLSCRVAHGRHAGSRRLPIHMNRARAAKSNAAAKFRSCQSQNVAQVPEQRHFRLTAERLFRSIHCQLDHFHSSYERLPVMSFVEFRSTFHWNQHPLESACCPNADELAAPFAE